MIVSAQYEIKIAISPPPQTSVSRQCARSGRQGRAGVIPLRCLPRVCSLCQHATIIGHGRRLRSAHDEWHERIWVRRGRCGPCRTTFTVLPDWLAPFGQYSLHCRQQTCERIAEGHSAEQAGADCKESSRCPDSSSVRRWAQRRVLSLWCWFKTGIRKHVQFLRPPTIFVWDLAAVCRILLVEARSP